MKPEDCANETDINETIAAFATPEGPGGIAVLRMSGPNAFGIAMKVFDSGKTAITPRKVIYGSVWDADGEIDKVLLTYMKAPASYTGEDTVEISCHGGRAVKTAVLKALFSAGARLAEPGEFTKRAFLNGKLDLTQAEAVADIINASTRAGSAAALTQLEGRVGDAAREIRKAIIELIASIMVYVDFPEEDLEDVSRETIGSRLNGILSLCEKLSGTYEKGRVLREGITAVIAGKPNTGKSSVMNLLLGVDRSIVTDIAGTTRDVVEESAVIGGVVLRLMDTAGIRESADVVERLGIDRTRRAVSGARLVIAVIDGSSPLDGEDLNLLYSLQPENTVVLINKSDLPRQADVSAITCKGFEVIDFCALKQPQDLETLSIDGMRRFEEYVSRRFGLSEGLGGAAAVNARHKSALDKTAEYIKAALSDNSATPDITAVYLERAAEAVGEVTGETVREEVLGEIFSSFCVGK